MSITSDKPSTQSSIHVTYQVLGIRQGQLDIHGVPKGITWTRLASTASANTTILNLQDPVDWLSGDQIVIAPTGKDGNETEVNTDRSACVYC